MGGNQPALRNKAQGTQARKRGNFFKKHFSSPDIIMEDLLCAGQYSRFQWNIAVNPQFPTPK